MVIQIFGPWPREDEAMPLLRGLTRHHLKYSSYHGSVNELKDNSQIEMLCYPSEMEHGEDRGNL